MRCAAIHQSTSTASIKQTSMPVICDQLAHPLFVKDSSSVFLDSTNCPVAVTELRCATESRMYWGASMLFRMSLTGSGAQGSPQRSKTRACFKISSRPRNCGACWRPPPANRNNERDPHSSVRALDGSRCRIPPLNTLPVTPPLRRRTIVEQPAPMRFEHSSSIVGGFERQEEQ